jgi:hypothetical protein
MKTADTFAGANMHAINSIIQGWSDWLDEFATMVRRLMMAVLRKLQDSLFVVHAAGKIRRFWLAHFRKDYIKRQLLDREGDCRQCGICCKLLFTCPLLTRQGKCLTYGLCRPHVCKVFPIDQRDLEEVELSGGRCGHDFIRAKLSSTTRQ